MLKYILLIVVVLISYGNAIEEHLSDEDKSFGILSHEILSQNVDLSSQKETFCILSQRTSVNTNCLYRDNKKSKNGHRNNYKCGWLGDKDNSGISCIIQEKYLNNILHIESVDILTKFCRLII